MILHTNTHVCTHTYVHTYINTYMHTDIHIIDRGPSNCEKMLLPRKGYAFFYFYFVQIYQHFFSNLVENRKKVDFFYFQLSYRLNITFQMSKEKC